jgi:hypothetical protein
VKKKLLVNLGLTLILTLLLFPATVLASSDKYIDTAQKAAQEWLDQTATANPELSQWNGAKATSPQPYESLGGDVNAYMFGVASEKGIVGHILVGSSQYGYDILEAGASAPPAVPAPSVAQEAVKSLGLKIDMAAIGQPIKLLYTGVDGYYALYEIQNQKVAVNLVFKRAILASDLKASITSPAEYQEGKKVTGESKSPSVILSLGIYTLPMYYWNGTSPAWCGPCSGVSIGAYYRDYKGYSNLYNPNLTMYNSLYYTMVTYLNGGATMPQDYGPGFYYMALACGYSNFTYANDWYVTGSDYWTVVSGINSGWPTALLITSQMHWRGIKGYYYYDPNNHYIFCTNSATGDSYELLNWDSLGLGLFTCRIKN